jgi:hypothetical protein
MEAIQVSCIGNNIRPLLTLAEQKDTSYSMQVLSRMASKVMFGVLSKYYLN